MEFDEPYPQELLFKEVKTLVVALLRLRQPLNEPRTSD
jgi:hypothetical protein